LNADIVRQRADALQWKYESLWGDLISYRKNSIDDAPLFRSRKGGHLHPSQVWRIVKKSAKRAGIKKAVSPHWFRHAHASHALDRGAI
jgi:integrase/recombinase XerD